MWVIGLLFVTVEAGPSSFVVVLAQRLAACHAIAWGSNAVSRMGSRLHQWWCRPWASTACAASTAAERMVFLSDQLKVATLAASWAAKFSYKGFILARSCSKRYALLC